MDTNKRSAHQRSRVLAMVAGMMTLVALFLMPHPASASSYTWRVNADGEWTNPANWSLDPGSGPLGPGYPTARGDVARLADEITNFTGHRTITIPDNVHITVAVIYFRSSFGITIRAGGPNCRLDLDNGTSPAQMLRFVVPDGNDLVTVPIRLLSPLVFQYSTGALAIEAPIGEAGGPRSLTKRSSGLLSMTSPAASSYTGPTIVESGQLALGYTGGPAVLGELVIGNGTPGDPPAEVGVNSADQIADFANVRVNSDGLLRIVHPERIGDLVVNGGTVVSGVGGISLPQPATLTMRSLTMTGGLLESAGNGRFVLEGNVTATSDTAGPAVIRRADAASGTLDLLGSTRIFVVNQGPSASHDLELGIRVSGSGSAGLTKDGTGRLRFTGSGNNTYPGVTLARQGRIELAKAENAIAVPGGLQVGDGTATVVVELMAGISNRHNIANTASVSVGADSTLILDSDQHVASLAVGAGGRVVIGAHGRPRVRATSLLTIVGGRLSIGDGSMALDGDLVATSTPGRQAVIDGRGGVEILGAHNHNLFVLDGPEPVDLLVASPFETGSGIGSLTKRDSGVVQLGGTDNRSEGITVSQGTVLVTGSQRLNPITLAGGVLGGTGRVGAITASIGRIAPGLSAGRLSSGSITLSASATLAIELNGTAPGTTYDQLAVTGSVSLGNAALVLTASSSLRATPHFVLIDNDGTDPVTGTFAALGEGTTITVAGRELTLSYRGGDGNDVVLSDLDAEVTYFLAEGATGEFFDDDVLIANPTTTGAPVTLTFLLEGGRTIVEHRTVPAQARLTVHVDEIPGLEWTSASVQVTSDDRVPLVVERTMFWDASGYGGHTANAVAQPETRWIFAEGFQGFFDTFILLANANADATTATLTFLLEGAAPVVKTVPIEPFARKTVYAADYPEVVERAFGVVVEATRPIIAERAMYFASTPGRIWAGGHVNTGIVAPATSWFHAEGATGTFFSTFILLSNPNDTPAQVELQFLLDTGQVITRQKTLGARARLTINPAAEGDVRLANAAVSTVVQSDVPIVSERSMYWRGEAAPVGEGHNSSGVDRLATRWGLAEGRVGGAREYATYILLANPGAQAAQVTITYLRESGAPVVQTYTVPPTSRFNVDVTSVVPELRDASFGARIESTNGVPIAVERSIYWNAAGVFWAGGSNALGTPLP